MSGTTTGCESHATQLAGEIGEETKVAMSIERTMNKLGIEEIAPLALRQNISIGDCATAAPDGEDDRNDVGPLVIDLDGTLLQTNVLIECALSLIRHNPLVIFQMLVWLLKGRANLKQELARRAALDTASLPLNPAVEAYAASEKAKGRKIYLATAADRVMAEAIATRCGFFDGVLASDGKVNLKGRRKAEALGNLFPGQFAYAGDSRADVPVWSRASEAIFVGDTRWAQRMARRLAKPVQIFGTPSRWRALAKCVRPHQWAKNTLVFVPAILGGNIFDHSVFISVFVSFVALCLVASSTYLLNDIWDVADDRRHWSKRHRPIASGALPISTALTVLPIGLAAGLLLGALDTPAVDLILCLYVALTLAYSFVLKRVPVLDVLTLAGLFTLRLGLGIAAAKVYASPWLLMFSMFLFSSLCFAKRYVEIVGHTARGRSAVANRGYQAEDATLVSALGMSTGICSIAIMGFYIIFDAFQRSFYGETRWLWAFPIILFLWFSRVWLVAGRGELDDDPVAFAVKDTQSIVLGGAMLVAFCLAWSGLFR
jgi:4-hydroxybenzoate polyprenyltransferase